MSKSKKVFITGISMILALLVILGCLPNKQGGFTCIATPLLSKIQSLIPTAKKTTSPVQLPPQDIKVEEAKINKVIGQLCTAFKVKDIEGALKYFAEDEREIYRQAFTGSPGILPEIAADLEKAKINTLSFNSDEHSRIAEYVIKSGSQTSSIVFINIEGQWLLKEF